MTQPTLPAEHAHRGGSFGGPGENSAECACGLTFDGFDTHREAVAELDHHIRDEQKTKRADGLTVGDWVAMLLDGDPWETRQNAEVLATFPYTDEVENARVLVVAKSANVVSPAAVRLLADQPVRVLTADELAAIREQADRAQRIADIRAFADFLECNPWAPLPYQSAQAEVPFEAIGEYGERVGVPADTRLDDRTQVFHRFGGFEYRVIAWHKDGRPAEPAAAAVDPDPTGLTYSRVDDDPQVIRPHSPRLPLHTGAVVDGGQLVDETPADHKRNPLVHLGLRGRPRCGMSMQDSTAILHGDSTTIHPVEVTCEDCREAANLAPVEEIRRALDEATAAGPVLTPAGLTVEADLSRGPLAGTAPVVTYFSFGYGQTDPDTGKKLIDHYVTVVAPTYEECREAMFASRFGNRWSWDYLAGRAKTTEAVSQWTEHEVIVAPGTDQELAKAALKAAGDLLYGAPVSEAR